MQNFINENYSLIFEGLKSKYNVRHELNPFYLTEKQIEGIIDYLESLGVDNINIEMFIDETIINCSGFDESGYPIEEGEY